MNQQTTLLPGLEATLNAHREDSGGFLLVTVTASGTAPATDAPLQAALVIDRSGSMDGPKLEMTRRAAGKFIRSLGPRDRVSVVLYDDEVDLLCGLEAPSAQLAARVERTDIGGSTNLYGGWVTGAKIAGRGGRVILLSDGLANVGRYTDAESLSRHAKISSDKFGVTTTTIGVGRDYDEALMAGMARHGGGNHYYAHAASAIGEAFSQERYSMKAMSLESVTIRVGGTTLSLGHFWAGETKSLVFPLDNLEGVKASIRFTARETGTRTTSDLILPQGFGYSEDVRLEMLLHQAADIESEMVEVRSPRRAAEMKGRLRGVVLALLAHPSSDEEAVSLTIARLQDSMKRLESLEHNFIEEDAVIHRKKSLQMSHNLKERAKAFSSFEEEQAFVAAASSAARSTKPLDRALEVNRAALQVIPLERWIAWQALPLEITEEEVVFAMEEPRNGFVLHEVSEESGRAVNALRAGISAADIVDLLRAAGEN